METPLFFQNGPHSLFGVLHEADHGSQEGRAVVFCHPFGEEKLWTHRVFVSFARRLARDGFTVLRFDYMGNGDSDGDFSASSLQSARADVRCAIERVRRDGRAERVTLLGLRLGAMIAGLVAEEESAVDRLILWAPIVDGARYMQELLRANLTTQMATAREITHDREALVALMHRGETVNVDGYEMSLPMFSEVSAVKLASSPKQFSGPCLVAQVERQAARPVGELHQLAERYGNATFIMVQEEPFWKEIARFYEEAPNLFSATTAWLKES
jgi:exosortase A-associated hydrolase 2